MEQIHSLNIRRWLHIRLPPSRARARRGEIFDHVVPFEAVTELPVIVPRAHAGYDSQPCRSMLMLRYALCLSHQQRPITLRMRVRARYYIAVT